MGYIKGARRLINAHGDLNFTFCCSKLLSDIGSMCQRESDQQESMFNTQCSSVVKPILTIEDLAHLVSRSYDTPDYPCTYMYMYM